MALLPTDGQTDVRGRRRSNIELTLAATSITPPFSLLRSFHVASLPLALSLSSFNLSITCKKSRLRTTEGGSGDFGGRARVVLARRMRLPLPPPAPSERAACCSQVPTVSCTVQGPKT